MTEEGEWILRVRQGDAQAWEALVQSHQQVVFRLAYLLLGDADDAEDVAQETFIRAYRSLDGFQVDRPLRPWLLRITANLSSNRRRSTARYLTALQRLLHANPAPASAPQQAEQNLEAETLWKAVRQLPLIHQQVIYLRYFLECSEAETAQVLGLSAGTVKSRQHRALMRLRMLLQKDYPHLEREGMDVF